MNVSDIKELVKVLEGSTLKKLHIKEKDFELHLEKGTTEERQPRVSSQWAAPLPEREEPMRANKASSSEKEGVYVKAPMVGTFYSSPTPEEPKFVKVGDRVSADTVVCIVEAMKVMNEVKAGKSGIVAEILVENGQPVEFGTKLFRIA